MLGTVQTPAQWCLGSSGESREVLGGVKTRARESRDIPARGEESGHVLGRVETYLLGGEESGHVLGRVEQITKYRFIINSTSPIFSGNVGKCEGPCFPT